MSGISTLSRPYESITHLEQSFSSSPCSSRTLFIYFSSNSVFNAESRANCPRIFAHFSNENSRNSRHHTSVFFQSLIKFRFLFPLSGISGYQASLRSCLFFYLDGVYIHTPIPVAPEGIYAVASSSVAEFPTLFYLPTYANLFGRPR